MTDHPITPPPPHLLKKFSAQARNERSKRNGTGYLKTFATLCIEWAMNCQATPNDRQIRSSEIQPPPELVHQWVSEFYGTIIAPGEASIAIATQAARWGADQELDACCEWLDQNTGRWDLLAELRLTRRPKTPSDKELALAALDDAILRGDCITTSDSLPIIRRALEQLND